MMQIQTKSWLLLGAFFLLGTSANAMLGRTTSLERVNSLEETGKLARTHSLEQTDPVDLYALVRTDSAAPLIPPPSIPKKERILLRSSLGEENFRNFSKGNFWKIQTISSFFYFPNSFYEHLPDLESLEAFSGKVSSKDFPSFLNFLPESNLHTLSLNCEVLDSDLLKLASILSQTTLKFLNFNKFTLDKAPFLENFKNVKGEEIKVRFND